MNFDGTTIPPSIDLKDPAPDNVSDLGLPSILSANEIHKSISYFSEGYAITICQLKSLLTASNRRCQDLYDVTQSGKIEDARNNLYLNYLDLVKAVDTNLFGIIVQSNFDISYGIELCRDSRLQIEGEIATAQDLSDELLTEPRDNISYSNMSMLHSQPSQKYDSNMINLTYLLPSKQKNPIFAINSICNTMPKWRRKTRR